MSWCGGKNQKPETGGSVGQQCGSEIINSMIPWPVSQLRLSPRKPLETGVLVAALKDGSAVFSVPVPQPLLP